MVCGPPCSLHVSASRPVHGRSVTRIHGNVKNLTVRCSNRIWSNFVPGLENRRERGWLIINACAGRRVC